MSNTTILFESVEAATKAFTTLKPMIEVSLDCNALTYDEMDEELVRWLVCDRSLLLNNLVKAMPNG